MLMKNTAEFIALNGCLSIKPHALNEIVFLTTFAKWLKILS